MSKKILIVRNKNDLERCYPVIKELRPHLTFEQYVSIYEDAHARNGYESTTWFLQKTADLWA